MTQEEKDKSVALFDKEVEDFCKETFIKDKETKELIFCCARHFTDWQKQRTIDKACEWLNKNVVEYHPRKCELRPIINTNAFREAMEGEQPILKTEITN